MTLFERETETGVAPEECAHEVMEVVPLVMRTIRAEMRRHRQADLSVIQFRALAFLRREAGASLSEVADHIGLTLPSTSKMVDSLVENGLITRAAAPDDRRRIRLNLTDHGQATLQAMREATEARLAERLAALPPAERALVMRALQALRPIFAPEDSRDFPSS